MGKREQPTYYKGNAKPKPQKNPTYGKKGVKKQTKKLGKDT